jgi:DnaK suppressor protein
MARRDALLRLHKSLVARRAELRKRLGGELEDLRNLKATDPTGDSADAAFDSGSEEIASQLAELEARELSQIERALVRIKQGTYGLCEGCQTKIPVARLNALPYSTTCVKCQREMEMYGTWSADDGKGNWDKVSDADARLEDQPEIDLSDLEMDLTK